MRRAWLLVALVVIAITVASTGAARADAGSESQLLQLVNSSRASAGLAPLVVASDLSAMARQRAADMAAQGNIYHQSLAGIDGQRVGENVGVASTIDYVHQLMLGSESHRENIFGDFTEIGIGVVWADGQAYVDELFRLPWPAAPAAAAAPAPVADPATPPAPEPAPAPLPVEVATTTTATVAPATTAVSVAPPTSVAVPAPLVTEQIAHAAGRSAPSARPAPPRDDAAAPAAVPAAVAGLLLAGLYSAHACVRVRLSRR